MREFLKRWFPVLSKVKRSVRLVGPYLRYCNKNPEIAFLRGTPPANRNLYTQGGDGRRSADLAAQMEAVRTTRWLEHPLGKDMAETLRICAPLPTGPIVDVGCGDGRWMSLLANTFPGVARIGVEIDSSAVEVLRTHDPANSDGMCSYMVGTLSNIPTANDGAPLICAIGVCQVLEDIDAAIEEVWRKTSKYFFIGNCPLLRHHQSMVAYNDNGMKLFIRNRGELLRALSPFFDVVRTDYHAHGFFVDAVDEFVVHSNFLLQKKQRNAK